ncbi:MAG: xanthine dehydrogenase family protein molybdopterin-binding subunit [Chloroflexi bacterium]|nr:xanthine dehydrogenase family protein molybdopterin-binding subunit [Chloroflexota bacterium]
MSGKMVGRPIPRIDGAEKATGRARFAGDLRLPRMLTGKVVRSSFPHARILDIDTSRAERLAGVKAVVTWKDAPDVRFGFVIQDQRIIARDKVRHLGEAVAAVAAVDEATAAEAAGLIRVEYEQLPAVFDPIEAMRSDAPQLHDAFESYPSHRKFRRYGNVCNHSTVKRGNVLRAFDRADVVVEETYRTQVAVHGYIETHSVLVDVDASGRLTLWMSSQAPFGAREQLAEVLEMPMSKIRVVVGHIGGGFGGKNDLLDEPLAALLALKSHLPVRMVMSRRDEFFASNPRHATEIWLQLGAARDGSIVATRGRFICDAGAYASFSPHVASSGPIHLCGPYKVDNLLVEGLAVMTNKVVCGACRAPAVPQATFALESTLDTLARKLGIDPIELRLKNAVEDGDLSPTGQVYRDLTFKGNLENARRFYQAARAERRPNRGVGVASGYWGSAGFGSSAGIRLNEDGTLTLFIGAVETGAGSSTAFAQVVADELGVDISSINVVCGDTDSTPYDAGAFGSRTTYAMGMAVKGAADETRRQILEVAAAHLEANLADLQLESMKVFVKGSPDRYVALSTVASRSHSSIRGPIQAVYSCLVPHPSHDPACVESVSMPSKPHFAFATDIAEVEVDPETGQTTILRVTAIHDLGQVINRLSVEGQIQGGVAQGVGLATGEKVRFDENGAVLNSTFADYYLPTALDEPPIQPVILEQWAKSHPLGVRGIGEPTIVPVAAAVANAVFDAVGVRETELPITPEKIASKMASRE